VRRGTTPRRFAVWFTAVNHDSLKFRKFGCQPSAPPSKNRFFITPTPAAKENAQRGTTTIAHAGLVARALISAATRQTDG
jgi:hypothetical protein